MKLNWGNSIVLAFILFCAFIVHFVVRAFSEDVDLVSETYYKDEINYQQRMAEKSNLANAGVNFTIDQDKEKIVITAPDRFREATGKIHFYHPSRQLFDRTYEVNLNALGTQEILKDEIVKGRYIVKLSWESDGIPYYQEYDIYVK